jgi:four helix bundle protein
MQTHRDLEVWKNSFSFVLHCYTMTKGFPESERFGLVSQIRRAAVSVPANISEGAVRHTIREFVRFLRISMGSLSELETLILIAESLHYIDNAQAAILKEKIHKISAQLSGLIRFQKNKLEQKPLPLSS